MQNTMRFSELHCREVINLCDGARMGEVSDLLFDPVCGQITALVVPAQSGIAGLFSKNDCVIPWGCIETLGEDYSLVRYREKYCRIKSMPKGGALWSAPPCGEGKTTSNAKRKRRTTVRLLAQSFLYFATPSV